MKTIAINLYDLDELDGRAKEKALQEYAYFNVEDDWWQNVYEDAKTIDLKLTGFDIDRGAYCNGEFIGDALECANLILVHHGNSTPTYKTARSFSRLKHKSEAEETAFLQSLLREYLTLLRSEYDYQRAVVDAIAGNDFLFTADGRKARRLESLAQTT